MAETTSLNQKETFYNKGKDDWYNTTIGSKLGDPARQLLETYSQIPSNEVEKHVYEIRDKAWEVWPYPCIGQFRFLDLSISQSRHYPAILQRLKTQEQTLLDLGCCFGQDLRKLAADGASSERLYGNDLRPEFFDLGYELFRDRETLKSKFLVGDVFDSSSPLSGLDGEIDIIYAASFLHLFSYEDQVKVCERIVKLLKPKKDAVVLGRQIGNQEAGEQKQRLDPSKSRWRHNEASFREMWEKVGRDTGTSWRVEVESEKWAGESDQGRVWSDEGMIRLRFAVFRES